MIHVSLTTSPAWTAAGWTMLHFLWAGGILAVCAAFGRMILRNSHPNIRYIYSLASLSALVGGAAIIACVCAKEQHPDTVPGRIAIGPGVWTKPRADQVAGPMPTPVPFASSEGVDHIHAATKEGPSDHGTTSPRGLDLVAKALPAAWLLGSPLTFAYLALGLAGVENLRRCSRLADDLTGLSRRLADALGVAGDVSVRVCDRITAPILLGVLRPVILLPSAAITGWSPDQIEMALLHELAHVRRWDNAVNLVQRLIESLLFFHPAVWLISGWVRCERECCCDRIVVDRTGRALAYAEMLFALTANDQAAASLGVSMAEGRLVTRIRRILNKEELSMRISRTALGVLALFLFLPVILAGAYGQQTGTSTSPPPAKTEGQEPLNKAKEQVGRPEAEVLIRDVNFRRLHQSGGEFRSSSRDGVPKLWNPGPVPETVPVKVEGRASDEQGRPVPGASIFLYALQTVFTVRGVQEPKLLGKATTDAAGRYQIAAPEVPVVGVKLDGTPLQPEITPYAPFIVCGTSPDLGLAWSRQRSTYAFAEPHPNDIQGRLPLGRAVGLNLTFPRKAALIGRVVDEDSKPIPAARLRVVAIDLLDDAGKETNNGLTLSHVLRALPDSIGSAVTDAEGRFRMDGLPDRACFYLRVARPETDNTAISMYAATIDGPDVVHEELPPNARNGRLRHNVRANNFTVTFPKIRPIAVSLVAADTGQPVPNARVSTLGDDISTGTTSHGTTDAAGKVMLGLPPGEYRGIVADPSIDTNYIRTYQRPLIVERGEGEQPYAFRLNPGCELQIEAVDADSGKPIAGAFFWKAAEGKPDRPDNIQMSTFMLGRGWTDEKGLVRGVLTPEPGKQYRIKFAGIRQPNRSPDVNPSMADKQGYVPEPLESESVEMVAGKTIRLRFQLRKK